MNEGFRFRLFAFLLLIMLLPVSGIALTPDEAFIERYNLLSKNRDLSLASQTIKPFLGVLTYSTEELFVSTGVLLELTRQNFLFGIGFHKGMTKQKTLLYGPFSNIPVYAGLRWKWFGYTLDTAAGICILSHQLEDTLTKSYADLGYPQFQQRLNPGWLFLIGGTTAIPGFYDWQFSARLCLMTAPWENRFAGGTLEKGSVNLSGFQFALTRELGLLRLE